MQRTLLSYFGSKNINQEAGDEEKKETSPFFNKFTAKSQGEETDEAPRKKTKLSLFCSKNNLANELLIDSSPPSSESSQESNVNANEPTRELEKGSNKTNEGLKRKRIEENVRANEFIYDVEDTPSQPIKMRGGFTTAKNLSKTGQNKKRDYRSSDRKHPPTEIEEEKEKRREDLLEKTLKNSDCLITSVVQSVKQMEKSGTSTLYMNSYNRNSRTKSVLIPTDPLLWKGGSVTTMMPMVTTTDYMKMISSSVASHSLLRNPLQAKPPPPPPVPLSDEQKKVLSLVSSGTSLFFTGSAGTGKSFVLREIISLLKNEVGEENVFVTASTGVAACNIGGMTLHSFAGLGLAKGDKDKLLEQLKKNQWNLKRWKKAQVLIIDEISMVSPDFFDKLEYIARKVRNSELPFGGIQLVVCGDFLQLPPVEGKDKEDTKYNFCFETPAWKSAIKVTIQLQKIFRQSSDPLFMSILNEIRMGILSEEANQVLTEKAKAKSNTATNKDGRDPHIEPTRLYPHRMDVEQENIKNLQNLQTASHFFDAEDVCTNEFYANQLNANCIAPLRLELKENAQVILLKNIDFDNGLVNGARGVVIGFEDTEEMKGCPIVRFTWGSVWTLTPKEWSIDVGGQTVAKRKQIPLCLAWAMSIHKSQGMTIDNLEVSLASVFEYGQAYVALSRATSLAGLKLRSFSPSAIKAHPKVIQFYSSLQSA